MKNKTFLFVAILRENCVHDVIIAKLTTYDLKAKIVGDDSFSISIPKTYFYNYLFCKNPYHVCRTITISFFFTFGYTITFLSFSPVCYLLVYSFILFSFVRDSVAPKMEAKASATFTVTRSRKRTVVVSFQSDQLAGVRGECVINVT